MKKEKNDKGPYFFGWYWNLSYRRKLIRSLFITVAFSILAVSWFFQDNSIADLATMLFIFSTATLVFIVVSIYNFFMWNKIERNKNNRHV